MSAAINDLVINISLSTTAVTSQDFGTALIVGSRETGDALIGTGADYSELSELLDAGFETTDPEYIMLAHFFAQSPRLESVGVYIRDASEDIKTVMNSVFAAYSHYVILTTDRVLANLQSFGDVTLSNERLFVGGYTSEDILTDRSNIREAYLIHDKAATKYYEAAWVGRCLPYDIGKITWKWQCPEGVAASSFTLTELKAIRAANGQSFSKRSGYVYADNGITTGGQFIDVIMARDYVKAMLSDDIFALNIKRAAEGEKVPMDDTGGAQIESTIRERFRKCGKQGIIAKAESEDDLEKSDEGEYMFTVSVPQRSELEDEDRADRNWAGITFKFTVAGAVHGTEISGVIEV